MGNREKQEVRVLAEEDREGMRVLGYSWSNARKWWVIFVTCVAQLSMNFNAAAYPNAVVGIRQRFGISDFLAKGGQGGFLMLYGFGCELWAPWSEELGRWWVLQGSLFLVNVCQLPCALGEGYASILVGRLLGGLSSAGGSVTLGIVADLFDPQDQQYAVTAVVLASNFGSVLGPIVGGPVEQFLSWRWIFWLQLIFGFGAQALHWTIKETRTSVLLDREAQRLRESGEDTKVYGPDEVRGTLWQRLDRKTIVKLMWRPYQFLLTEWIVGLLSLLSGFSDALIFTCLDSYVLVFDGYGYNTMQKGLSFLAIGLSYIIGVGIFTIWYHRDRKAVRNGRKFGPERRLKLLLYIVPLLCLGLVGFAFSSLQPYPVIVHFFTAMIGLANFSIYLATIDYMVAAYGPYAASATGGNGFCRDFLAGIAAFYAKPLYGAEGYTGIAKGTRWQLVIPSLILAAFAFVLIIPVYIFYFHGEQIRARSPFATSLQRDREEHDPQRREAEQYTRETPPSGQMACRGMSFLSLADGVETARASMDNKHRTRNSRTRSLPGCRLASRECSPARQGYRTQPVSRAGSLDGVPELEELDAELVRAITMLSQREERRRSGSSTQSLGQVLLPEVRGDLESQTTRASR